MMGVSNPRMGAQNSPRRSDKCNYWQRQVSSDSLANVPPATDLIPPRENAISDLLALGYSATLRP
jgi:hypothetical protein